MNQSSPVAAVVGTGLGRHWPEGFWCPACGDLAYCVLKFRAFFQCHCCRHQASLAARTIFEKTRLSPTTCFLAIYTFQLRAKRAGLWRRFPSAEGIYETLSAGQTEVLVSMRERDGRRPLN